MIFEPVCQELLIRSRITRRKGEGRIDYTTGDPRDSNYIIRLEHLHANIILSSITLNQELEYYLKGNRF
jgi:hypothetical protein